MTDLKCPYCQEVRPTRSYLARHVDHAHWDADSREGRMAAVAEAREIQDVVVTGPELAEPEQSAVTEMPTRIERAELHLALEETNGRLYAAGNDIRELRELLDVVDERVKELDQQLIAPSVVRRATLNQVWDRLVDEGHLGAAALVMKMISRVVDEK